VSAPVSTGAADAAADPRIPLRPRTAADTEGEVQRVLEKLDRAGINKKVVRILANSPTGFRPFVLLTSGLLTSAHFPRLDQEIVILHLAARRGTPYEWAEHVPMGRESGVTEEQVAAIERNQGAVDRELFTDAQLLAVAVADEVIDERSLDPRTWSRAVGVWGEAGALDLLMSVAVWGAFVPTILDGLGVVSLD
jgi:4-carboxymuconolactone decarboxylase